MKKLLIAAAIASTTTFATAHDITVRGGQNLDVTQNAVGVALGTKVGAFGFEAAFDRTTSKDLFNRWSVGANYDVTKVMGVTVTARTGVAWVDRNAGSDGAVALFGVGVGYPVYKNTSLVLDYTYQRGQSRVEDLDGSVVTAGLKYKF